MKAIYLLPAAISLASCASVPDYDATGIFEATTVTVPAETSGRILSLPVTEGDSIGLGTTIAQIDTVILALRRDQLRSQQESIEATSPDIATQASSLRDNISHIEGETARLKRLLADGAAAPKQLDDAEAQLRSLRSQHDALLSTLSKNRGSVAGNAKAIGFQREQIEEEIIRSSVKAPISGTVLAKYAEQGEYASPGKPLVKIADLGNVYLRAYFTASRLADIRLGQTVTVTADFGGDKRVEYPGTITWIAQESEFTPKSIQTSDTRSNLVYAVKVAVRNDGRLKLGQYGEVRL